MTTKDSRKKVSLEKRVEDWLAQEGYPLEFFTANAFQRCGFHVRQGSYTEDKKADTVREIDVLAESTRYIGDGFIRIAHVIECKWTGDKPWVVFSGHGRMTPSGCIAQTIGSKLGQAILWLVAQNEELYRASVFSTPTLPGFGGRQVFTKGNDTFYSTIQAVVSKAKLYAEWYDGYPTPAGKMPPFGCITLPIIVIDGDLLEASYDESSHSIRATQTQMSRIHWKGSETWRLHATVDIVTKNYLEEFVAKRRTELKTLFTPMEAAYNTISECFSKGNIMPLKAKLRPTPRGVVGLPEVLYKLTESKKKKMKR